MLERVDCLYGSRMPSGVLLEKRHHKSNKTVSRVTKHPPENHDTD